MPERALSDSHLYQVYDGVVREHLPVFTLVVGLIHLLLAVGFAYILMHPLNQVMAIMSAGVAATSIAIWLGLRIWSIPSHWSHPILLLITLLAQINSLVYIRLSGEMRQTMFIFFIVLSSAQFFLSSRWYFLVLTVILSSWVGIAWQLEHSPFYFGSILVIGAGIATVMFYMRRRSIIQYERLRLQDDRRKQVLQHRARQLETSLAVGQHIVSILELDDLLHQVVALIKAQYNYDYVGVFLLDKEHKQLRIKAGTGEAGRRLCRDEALLPVDENSLVGWVAVNGRPLRVDDVLTDHRYVELKTELRIRSELDLPLWMGSNMLGVLTIQSRQIAAFSEDDLNFLQLLATQVAIAIYNASLYQGEKSARHLAETLQDTGRALTSTLEWDGVIDLILERLGSIVTFDRAGVLVRRDNELEMVAARGFPAGSEPLKIRISLENEIIYREINETKRPLSISDVQQRPDWRKTNALHPPHSWLGVPLIRHGAVTGMLSLSRETIRPYTDEEIELADAFAGQAVIALENALLYEQTHRFNQQLEYEVRHRTEAIRTAYEELEHLNRSKSDFISIVSHELRTPVTILSGYSQMLIKDQIIQGNEMLHHLATGMQSGAVRLQEIINSMLDVAKIDNRELKIYPGPVSIPAMVRIASIDFAQALEQRHISLVIEEMHQLPVMQADSEALQKVFFHLITNAIKYTPDGGQITISGHQVDAAVIGLPDKKAIEVVVADTGIGIDSAMHELIFNKFYQTGQVSLHSSSRTMFKGGGPGLGLAVCRGIVEAHRGKLWVESRGYDEETCPGSQFFMVLPILEEEDW